MSSSPKVIQWSFLVPIMACFMGFFSISGDSYWIDEGNAIFKARQDSLLVWFQVLCEEGGSDAQMPGYMFSIWVWEKIVGSGEWAMRSSNLIWMGVMIWALWKRPAILLLVAVSPFTVYYMNELRPYMMQIALGAVILRGMEDYLRDRSGLAFFVVGGLLLCSSSLLGVLIFSGFFLFLVLSTERVHWAGLMMAVVKASPALLILGGYYLWTLTQGIGAAAMSGGVVLSFAQVGYELLGFGGVGPGRNELRENPMNLLKAWPTLLPMVTVVGLASLYLLKAFFSMLSPKRIMAILVSGAFVVGSFVILIVVKDFRLLGRHWAPLIPVLGASFAMLTVSKWNVRKSSIFAKLSPPLVFGFLCVAFLISGILIRTAPRHKKDNYREAATIAKEAQRPVYFLADSKTACFYGISPDLDDIREFDPSNKNVLLVPDALVILSKPDIYDPEGVLMEVMQEQGFQKMPQQLQGFSIYSKDNQ